MYDAPHFLTGVCFFSSYCSSEALCSVIECYTLPSMLSIIKLFGHCKGGNFNFHICAWFGYFICSIEDIRFYLLLVKSLNKFMSLINVHAFHENPDSIYTELTFY